MSQSDNDMKFPATIAATCALASAANFAWNVREPLPEGLAGGAAAYLGDRLLYAGGTTWRDGVKVWLSTVSAFDTATNKWSVGPQLPEALAYGPAILQEGTLELLGGMNGSGISNHVWRLTRGKDKWEPSGLLYFPTALARAAVVKNRVYVFGGCPDVASLVACTDDVMVRDGKGLWTKAGKLPDGAVALSASAVASNKVYLFGGCRPTGAATLRNVNDAWRFDPATGKWQALRPLPSAARSMSAASIAGSRILLAGGYTASQETAQLQGPEYGFSSAAWIYDPARDEYLALPALPAAIAGIEWANAGERLFGIGGEDRLRGRSASVLEFVAR